MADTTTTSVSASTELPERAAPEGTRIRWESAQRAAGMGGADGLPGPMIERLLRNPDSLREMLSAVVTEAAHTHAGLSVSPIGTVRQVGDGVASVWGLPRVTTDELLRFASGVYGLVMNLETDWIDCVLLGSDEGIQGGDMVWPTGRRITVPVGDRMLGRVVTRWASRKTARGTSLPMAPLHRRDAGLVERQAVAEPLHTGLKAVDASCPSGAGSTADHRRPDGQDEPGAGAIISQNDTDGSASMSASVSASRPRSGRPHPGDGRHGTPWW